MQQRQKKKQTWQLCFAPAVTSWSVHVYVWKQSQGLQTSPILIQLGHWEANLLKFQMVLILRLTQADLNDRCGRLASDYSIKGMCYLVLQHLRKLPKQEWRLKQETEEIERRLPQLGQGARNVRANSWPGYPTPCECFMFATQGSPPPSVPETPLSWINPVSCFVS